MAKAADLKIYKMNKGEVRRKTNMSIPGIFGGKVTLQRNYGENSEEHILTKAWEELVKMVPIIDPLKFIIDLEDLGLSWPWSVLGCHLVKDLVRPRYPLIMIGFLIKKFTKVQGEFLKEEDQVILDHLVNTNSKPDYKYLSAMLKRTEGIVYYRTRFLLDHGRSDIEKGPFCLSEDIQIFKNIFGRSIPQNFTEFKKLGNVSYIEVSKTLNRPVIDIKSRWLYVIKPTLSEHLFCGLSMTSRRPEVFKYIFESKAGSESEIDWGKLFQKWPFLTKPAVNKLLAATKKELGQPLYKQIETIMMRPTYGVRSAVKLPSYQRKLELVQAFDELRKEQRDISNAD